jgi:hypothetical protein
MHARAMARFLLEHRHEADECGVAYAAWKGFESPLRRGSAVASCLLGGHAIWWEVDASDPAAALALLPPFVAARTAVAAVREVAIP